MQEYKVYWHFQQNHSVGDFGLLQSTRNVETVSGECDIVLADKVIDKENIFDSKNKRLLQERLHNGWAGVFKDVYNKPEFASLPKKELIKIINKKVDKKEIGRLINFKIMCIEKKEIIEGQVKVAGNIYAYHETSKKVFMPVPTKLKKREKEAIENKGKAEKL